MAGPLDGKAAIVTGGGRGIGRAIALALAAEGARVVVSARTRAELDEVVAAIAQGDRPAVAVAADLMVADDVSRLVASARDAFGEVDIVVNAAGGIPAELYDPAGGLPGMSLDPWAWSEGAWDGMIASNLKTTFLVSRAVLPLMVARRRGDVVNIASRMGHVANPAGGAYAVAKHAVVAFTRMCAARAAPHGVRVNAVSPGRVETPGLLRMMAAYPGVTHSPTDPPETVAAAVLYLLRDAPDGMTGQALQLYPAQ